MYLKSLFLNNFRNYNQINLDFSSNYNIFLGDNGQGKSNLLESIYFLSLLRSFRTKNINNLKLYNSSYFHIKGDFISDKPLTLNVYYGEEKSLAINQQKINKTSSFIGQFYCLSLINEDLQMIKGASLLRRNYLNIVITQYEENYLFYLSKYNQVLKMRNKILKETLNFASLDKKLIKAIDEKLTFLGEKIITIRKDFFVKLEEELQELTKSISKDIFSCNYIPKIKDDFREKLEMELMQDFNYKMTRFGPHRDDFNLLLNNKNLKNYGSEGECRLACLLIKLAAGNIFQKKKDKIFILLLDDIIGELDEKYQDYLFSLLKADQTFLTCTKIPSFFQNKTYDLKEISAGKII